MILNALVQCYENLATKEKVPKRGYSRVKVSYALNLSTEGQLMNIIPLKIPVEQGKKIVLKPREHIVPEHVMRSSGVSANFLCDNSGYMLGIDKKGKPKRTLNCFNSCKRLTRRILNDYHGEIATAIKEYFDTWDIQTAKDNPVLLFYLEDIMAGANLIFYVNGNSSLEDPEVRDAWEVHQSNRGTGESMQCLITGKVGPIARLHPGIKGVLGAQSSGASLVSFNAPAYESYGHENGAIAPVGEYATFAYTTALNYLLSKKKNCLNIADMTVVFWEDSMEEEYVDLFNKFLTMKGEACDLDGNKGEVVDPLWKSRKIHILGLSPNAARLSVRFYIEESFETILRNLYEHQKRLEIVRTKTEGRCLSLHSLLRETVNLKSKDKTPSPLMSGAMLKAIFLGLPYPESFYQGLIMRAKVERKITFGKAAGIKAYLIHNRSKRINKEELEVKVNEEIKNKAYVLGRLFAVLERTQEEANPGIHSTVKERYFSSACATPAVVFPRLLLVANNNTGKTPLGKDRDIEIGKLMSTLKVEDNPFPIHLSLQEQGLFMLGYYQQREESHEKKEKEMV